MLEGRKGYFRGLNKKILVLVVSEFLLLHYRLEDNELASLENREKYFDSVILCLIKLS